jgi:hypothetical protein
MNFKDEDKFVLKNTVLFKDIRDGGEKTLPVSDLLLTDDFGIYQYNFIEKNDKVMKTVEVHPGIYTVMRMNGSDVALEKTIMSRTDILKSITNSKLIREEMTVFLKGLDIYKKLNEPTRRSILVYSKPGFGKSATIRSACLDEIEADPNTLVLIWGMDVVPASIMSDFLSFAADYKNVSKMILIIEDIGGAEIEFDDAPRGSPASLLNLLDGVGVAFRIPTFIIATTNHPEKLGEVLADRPGRFDQFIELLPLTVEDRISLVEFIARRSLSGEERRVLSGKDTDNMSVAHLKEIVIRSMLHNKPIAEVIKEIIEHTKKFKKTFSKQKGMGFSS